MTLLALLAGCQLPAPSPPSATVLPVAENWRAAIRPADAAQLAQVDLTRDGRGLPVPLRAEGQARAAPPPGSYRCRIWRTGTGPRPSRQPAQFCHVVVEGNLLAFTRSTGFPRLGGYLFPESDRRHVFLGATAAASRPPGYGADEARDLAGLFERVGAMRYRLVMPRRGAPGLEVMELVPIAPPLG